MNDSSEMTTDDMSDALDSIARRDEADAFMRTNLYRHISDISKQKIAEATEKLILSTDPGKDNLHRQTIMGLRLFDNLLDAIVNEGINAETALKEVEGSKQPEY